MFIVQSADLNHIFGRNLKQNQTLGMMKGKGPYYPQYSYGNIRILSLMFYNDFIEYNKVSDTKTPLLVVSLSFPNKNW